MSVNTALLAYERARQSCYENVYSLWASNDADPQEVEARRSRMQHASHEFAPAFSESDWPVYAVEPNITRLCLDAMDGIDWLMNGPADFMPTPFGFMHFMEPFDLEMPDHVESLRYITWFQVASKRKDSGDDGTFDERPATMFALGGWCPGDRRTVVRNFFPWLHGHALKSIYPVDYSAPYISDVKRIIAAIGLFMQQRIAVSHVAHASRNVYKRTLIRTGKEPPELRIVKLRATESRIYERSESEGREWSMRWIVRGHWRNQWYPTKKANSQIWIAPYIKGPAGKPVIGSRKIFEVSR